MREVSEVLGARCPLLLIDRCMGLDAQFYAAEFFTLSLTSGMCESSVYSSDLLSF